MDELELDYVRWMNFQHGANALMGFIEASIPNQSARVDIRTHSGWDGDNIATVAQIVVWDAKAVEERGIALWLRQLGWESRVVEEENAEFWTFMLQFEADPYK